MPAKLTSRDRATPASRDGADRSPKAAARAAAPENAPRGGASARAAQRTVGNEAVARAASAAPGATTALKAPAARAPQAGPAPQANGDGAPPAVRARGVGGPPGGGGPGGPRDVAIGGYARAEGGGGGGEGDERGVGGFAMRASAGIGLPGGVRASMEASLGVDLGAVRIHTESERATELDARAITEGASIHFAPGQFQPGSSDGRALLAHELTHVVQGGGGVRPKANAGATSVTRPSEAAEVQADAVATDVSRGGTPDSGGAIAGLHRASAGIGRKTPRKARAGAGGGGGGGGGGASAAIAGFVKKKPSERARAYSALGGEAQGGLDADVAATNAKRPELHAKLGPAGGGPEGQPNGARGAKPADGRVQNGPAGPPSSRGAPAIPQATPTNLPQVRRPAPTVSVPADAPPERGHAVAQNALAGIATNIPLSSSAGPRPKVPKGGDADPARADEAKTQASADAARAKAAAKQEVLDGRGPEVVQARLLDDLATVADIAQQAVQGPAPVDSLDTFVAYNLPVDVEAAFDEQQGELMEASLATAQDQVDVATSETDTATDTAVSDATVEAERLSSEASRAQDEAVVKARGDIAKARTDTLAAQDKAVGDLESQISSRHSAEVGEVRERIRADEAQIDTAFKDAEKQAADEIAKGQAEAEAKKKAEEDKAKDRSWWDRVKDAVSSVISAISDFVNAVIDRVRSAIARVLDAAKAFATDLITKAAAWVTEKLQAFAAWAKEQITATLGAVFPELAAKLNAAIDAATEFVTAKIDQLAEGLKQAVAAVCDGLKNTLDGLLATLQSAVNAALTLVEAALTGDWAKVARMVLEAVLKLAGIPPAEFYATMAKADDAIDTIVADPGAFVGNMIDAVKTGFGQFSDNFMTHLQGGFLEWITKSAAEAGVATLASFDLKDIFGFVLDTLGIDVGYIREKAVKQIGEENVQRVEWVMGVVGSAMEGGWDGLWEYAEGYVDGLYEMAIGKVQDFLMTRIVQAAVLKIASMFTPVGAIVQAVITAWNVYEFMRDQSQRIFGLVTAVVDSISDIAHGNIGGAANMVEGALAKLIPVAIDLLAKLLNVSGIAKKVQEIIAAMRERVDKAIDGMIEKVLGMFKGGKGKEGAPAAAGAAPGAAPSADGKGADGKAPAGGAGLDDATTFTAGGETHRVWVTGGATPTAMMASDPKPITEHIQNWRGALAQLPPEKSKEIGGTIGRVIGLQRGLEQARGTVAAAADDKRAAAEEKVKAKRLELGAALESLCILLPPGLAGAADVAKDAADLFKNIPPADVFVARYCELARGLGLANPEAKARDVWAKLIDTLQRTSPMWKDLPDVQTAAGQRKSIELKDDATRRIMAELNPIVAALEPLMSRFAGSRSVAFWSGNPAKEVAIKAADVALESSGFGRMFEGIRIPVDETMPLWVSLSAAYAQFVRTKVTGADYHGFVGLGSSAEVSIFNKIEQPTFTEGGGAPHVTFHAAVMDVAQGKYVPDWSESGGGYAGTVQRGTRDAMVAVAESEGARRLAEFDARKAAASGNASAQVASPNLGGQGTQANGGVVVEAGKGLANNPVLGGGVGKANLPGVSELPKVELQVSGGEAAAGGQAGGGGDVPGVSHAGSMNSGAPSVNGDTSRDVSKHAAGEPPAGWRAKVEASVPSGADDPGHTYHVLSDGSGVSESRPQRLKQDVTDRAARRAGLSVAELKRKTQAPKQTLAASGEMSAEELAKMEGALKKNPRSEEIMDATTGEKKPVAKPEVVKTQADGTVKQETDARNADGTARAPMSDDEKDALLKGHAVLARDNVAGAQMRKVVANNTVGGMLSGQATLGGAEKLPNGVRGSIGHQRNTDGMNAEDTVAALGLDYEHRPSDKKAPAGSVVRGQYTDMNAAGAVRTSQETSNRGLHYIDFEMTADMAQASGVNMSKDLVEHGKRSADPEIRALAGAAAPREKSHRDDAFAGTGATSSNALTRGDGSGIAPIINQELMLDARKKNGGAGAAKGEAAFDLPAGAQMKRRGSRAGEDKVVATLREERDADGNVRTDSAGKPLMGWELDEALDKNDRGTYKNMMDKARSDQRATTQQAGESDVDFNARKATRAAAIESSKKEGAESAAATGNPFPAGTAEWKSWNRQQRRRTAAPAASAAAEEPTQTPAPKDYPEPSFLDRILRRQPKDAAKADEAPTPAPGRTVAPNPGLRKEHEGQGVDYHEMKGEAFVKGEGDANDIDPHDVKQGSLGDCYLIGGMAAVARANPEYIRKLIRDNGDGTYDVTLYIKNKNFDPKGTAKTVTIDGRFPSSDKGATAKYARFGDKGPKGQELWTMLIEKAWAVHKGTYTGIEGGHVNDDGKFAGAIALLTNLEEGYYTPGSIGDAKLAQMIRDALDKKMPVACDSKNLDKEAPALKADADKAGVVGNHAYAPETVDVKKLTIDLQNPWGQNHVRGLSIADFKRFYRGVRIGK